MNTHDLTELATTWRKSSYSTATGNCVEVAPFRGWVMLRHSKRPTAGTIAFSPRAWAAFVREAREDMPSANGVATVTLVGTDTVVDALHTPVELRFDPYEWAAFRAGVNHGEFDFSDHLALAAS